MSLKREEIRMKNATRLLLLSFLFLFFAGAPVMGAPTVTGVQGAFTHGQAVQIQGANFGQKVPAKPMVWADFTNSLSPSPLGQVTNWSENRSMKWTSNGRNGGGAQSSDSNGYWALGVDANWTQEGQKIYIFRQTKMNFLITTNAQNWKSWRMWPWPSG